MDRDDLREIIVRVVRKLGEDPGQDAPQPACVFNDQCDASTLYSVGEEG